MRNNAIVQIVRPWILLALALSFLILVISPPAEVQALSTDKATARSNESNGNNVLGGQPTRITWEGTVGDSEQVSSITLDFPEGSSVTDTASAKATVLDGLTRVETAQDVTLSDSGVTIEFAKGVASGLLLRIEIFEVSLPAAGGDYVINGSYVDASGTSKSLAPSDPPITVIGMTGNEQMIQWLGQQPWVQAWNSVKFLNIFFNPQYIVASVPALFIGWLRSFGLVLAGFPLAIPIGLGISFLRMSKLRILKFISSIYVNVIRGTPLFLQIYIAFFGLPLLGLSVNEFVLGIIVLAMNSSAYLAEIFRAGIQSIHKGQFEASASLGMNGVQTMFSVIIPQTVRRVIPTATSEFILLYKDTSLLAAVGVMEQMMFAKSMVATTGNMTPYIVAAAYYLIVTLPLTRIITVFEKRLAASEGSQQAPNPGDKPERKGFASRLRGKVAPLSAVAADPNAGISPEEHMSGK